MKKPTKPQLLTSLLVTAAVLLLVPRGGDSAPAEAVERTAARPAPTFASAEAVPPLLLMSDGVGNVWASSRRVLGSASVKNARARRRFIETLRQQGGPALAQLRESLHHPRQQDVAAYGLAKLGDAADRRDVAKLYREKAKSVSPALALAAAALDDPRTLDDLIRRYDSKNPLVREAVAVALRKAIRPDVKVLLHLIMDNDRQVRETAESTVLRLKDGLASDEVRLLAADVMESGTPTLRRAVLRLCWKVRAPWAVDIAMAAVRDKNATVRNEALRTLGRLGDAQSTDTLLWALKHGSDRQTRVAGALALTGLPLAAHTRAEMLWLAGQEDDLVVVMAVAHSLFEHRDVKAVSLLVDVLDAAKDESTTDHARFIEKHVEAMLEASALGCPRLEGEDWHMWWARVLERFDWSPRLTVPKFPDLY